MQNTTFSTTKKAMSFFGSCVSGFIYVKYVSKVMVAALPILGEQGQTINKSIPLKNSHFNILPRVSPLHALFFTMAISLMVNGCGGTRGIKNLKEVDRTIGFLVSFIFSGACAYGVECASFKTGMITTPISRSDAMTLTVCAFAAASLVPHFLEKMAFPFKVVARKINRNED